MRVTSLGSALRPCAANVVYALVSSCSVTTEAPSPSASVSSSCDSMPAVCASAATGPGDSS